MAPDVADWTVPSAGRVATGLAVLLAAAGLAVVGEAGGILATAASSSPDSGTAQLTGLFVALAVVAVYLVAGTPYAFLTGQVGLVVGLGGGPTATPAAQALLVAPLLIDVAVDRDPGDHLATFLVATVAAGALGAVMTYTPGTALTGGVLLGATAFAVYSIHRYERLALDLVGDAG